MGLPLSVVSKQKPDAGGFEGGDIDKGKRGSSSNTKNMRKYLDSYMYEGNRVYRYTFMRVCHVFMKLQAIHNQSELFASFHRSDP